MLLRSNISFFPKYVQNVSNFRSQIIYSFLKCGCSIYYLSQFRKSDKSRYGYLEVIQSDFDFEITRVDCTKLCFESRSAFYLMYESHFIKYPSFQSLFIFMQLVPITVCRKTSPLISYLPGSYFLVVWIHLTNLHSFEYRTPLTHWLGSVSSVVRVR